MTTPKGKKLLADFEAACKEFTEWLHGVVDAAEDKWAMGRITREEYEQVLAEAIRMSKQYQHDLQRIRKDVEKAAAHREKEERR